MKRTFLLAALALLCASEPDLVQAHAMLVKAVPAVGGTIAASPARIAITFTEAVEPRFSGIALAGSDGHAVATGAPSVDPANHAVLVVPVTAALAPGKYTVHWHAVAVDTHRTQGSFSFEIKP